MGYSKVLPYCYREKIFGKVGLALRPEISYYAIDSRYIAKVKIIKNPYVMLRSEL